MTAPTARTTGWPSAPKVLVHAIGERFEAVYVATRFPGPEASHGDVQSLVKGGTGVVRVVRLGGDRDKVTDRARVAVDVVHASEGQAEDLAEQIATWLGEDPAVMAVGAVLDRITVEVAPHEVPYPDPTVSQFSMVLVATSRRMD